MRGENCASAATPRSPTTMSARRLTIGSTSRAMSAPQYWLSASVLTITSAPAATAVSSPVWNAAASPRLRVWLTM
ncbi:MAG: hypothetical protein BWY52_01031 [Chloroflexi bacterium ADurb.Bin325]|nr:MAG: hypothetical protein BWY52_01031 [Chloroflexi bacterium ADurb.Bin325]